MYATNQHFPSLTSIDAQVNVRKVWKTRSEDHCCITQKLQFISHQTRVRALYFEIQYFNREILQKGVRLKCGGGLFIFHLVPNDYIRIFKL